MQQKTVNIFKHGRIISISKCHQGSTRIDYHTSSILSNPKSTLAMNADNDVQQRKKEKTLPYLRHICVRAWDLLQEESTTVLSPRTISGEDSEVGGDFHLSIYNKERNICTIHRWVQHQTTFLLVFVRTMEETYFSADNVVTHTCSHNCSQCLHHH